MSMAKSKALNDAEATIRDTAEAACHAIGLEPHARVSWFGGGPLMHGATWREKIAMLLALPQESPQSTALRRHVIEYMPEPPASPDRREAKHEGPRRTKAG